MTKIVLMQAIVPDGYKFLRASLGVKNHHFDEKLISHLESLPISAEISTFYSLRKLCKNNPKRILKVFVKGYKDDSDDGIRYVGYNEKFDDVAYITIDKYDETKPHHIVVDDGDESIKEIKPADKKHNIWSV